MSLSTQNQEKYLDRINFLMNYSIALVGVCVTVISLFQVTNKRSTCISDDVFAFASGLFLVSFITAYFYTFPKSGKTVYKIAEVLFFIGIVILSISILLLAFEF